MQEVLRQAIEKYGPDMQTNVAIEEMSELTKELCKAKRGQDNMLYIAEEIADVEIMLEHLKIIYNIHDGVEDFKVRKITRLRDRLELGTSVYDPDTKELLGYIKY